MKFYQNVCKILLVHNTKEMNNPGPRMIVDQAATGAEGLFHRIGHDCSVVGGHPITPGFVLILTRHPDEGP